MRSTTSLLLILGCLALSSSTVAKGKPQPVPCPADVAAALAAACPCAGMTRPDASVTRGGTTDST